MSALKRQHAIAICGAAVVIGLAAVSATALLPRDPANDAGPAPGSTSTASSPSSGGSTGPTAPSAPQPDPLPSLAPEVAGLASDPTADWSIDAEAGFVYAIDDDHLATVGFIDPNAGTVEIGLVTVADGKDVWRSELKGDAFQVRIRPLTGTDLLVVHSDTLLYLVDRTDGSVKETYTTEFDSWYGSASDGSLWYLARKDDEQYPRLSKLRSRDPADAAWTTELATMPFMVTDIMVDVHGGHAFVTEASTDNVFRPPSNTLQRSPEAIAALALSDGTMPDWSDDVSLTWFDDAIVTASEGGTVTGLGEDGAIIWEATGQRALNLNGALIVSTPTSVSRLDPATGAVIWQAEVPQAEQFAVIGGDLAVVAYVEQGMAESPGAGLVTFLDLATGKTRSEVEVVLQTFPAIWRGEDQLLLSTRQGEAEKLWAIGPAGKVNYTYTTEEEMFFADAAGSLFAISKETITRLR